MYRTESEIIIRIQQLKKQRLAVLNGGEGLFLSPEELARAELLNDEIR